MLACRAGDDDDGTVDWEPVLATGGSGTGLVRGTKRLTDPQIGRQPKLWGAWSVPESELGALGPTAGLRALELGCGGAQWGDALAAGGEVVVGLDLSGGQLQAAQARAPDLPLVHAAAETLPFRSETSTSFFATMALLVGATLPTPSPRPPGCSSPEGGWSLTPPARGSAFATKTPPTVLPPACTIRILTLEASTREMAPGLTPSPTAHRSGSFSANGLVVEDLIEPRPAPDALSSYYTCDPADWANRWPGETLWVTQKTE